MQNYKQTQYDGLIPQPNTIDSPDLYLDLDPMAMT